MEAEKPADAEMAKPEGDKPEGETEGPKEGEAGQIEDKPVEA